MIWRWFWREWRSPSLLIVWLSLTLAVACVLALGNISDKIENTLNRQSRDFLAGDRVLRSSHPITPDWLNFARQQGLNISHQVSFMSMAYAGDTPLLASIKAVDGAYPLYGNLETIPAQIRLVSGQVLVAPRLLALLNLTIGQAIDVGDATFTIAGELIQEPDAGFSAFNTSPRILMHIDDIDKTGAVQPGSRLTYRYMFAGKDAELERFGHYVKPLLEPDQRFLGVRDSEGSVSASLKRAQQFLILSALLTLLLSAAAVAVATNHYCRSRYDFVAVLKTLGAGRKSLFYLIVGQWVSVLALAAFTGCFVGLLFEQILLITLKDILPKQLPSSSVWPLLWSIGSLVFISLLVGVRPYKQLLATLPLRVLRKDVIANVWPLRFYLPITLGITALVLAFMVGFSAIWWLVLLGLLALVAILGVTGWLSLLLLKRLTTGSLALRLSVNRLLRQPSMTMTQLGTFSLSFMLLALLFNLRGGLLDRWQQQLPAESPNYFLLNINDAQVKSVEDFLQDHGIEPGLFYPVVRVRLTKLNDSLAKETIKESHSGFEAINRELNLTWLDTFPPGNELLSGHWPPGSAEVSIEQGVAERLNLRLGDRVTFSGSGTDFEATISSIRRVNWESLMPNFYFIFPPQALDSQPQSWLTSFRYKGDGKTLAQLNRQFPTISLLDIDNILSQVSRIMEQVSRALEVMVGLVILCGFLLLFAQIQVGMRQRRQELVVYRTLGAGRKLLRNTLLSEFALMGLATGVIAAVGCEITLGLLQWQVFDFPWRPNVALLLILPLLCIVLLSLCGSWLGGRLFSQKALYRNYNE